MQSGKLFSFPLLLSLFGTLLTEMLQNEFCLVVLAKDCFDTADNEPSKVWYKGLTPLHLHYLYSILTAHSDVAAIFAGQPDGYRALLPAPPLALHLQVLRSQ